MPDKPDKILRFKCPSCGKTSIDDQPSKITQLMTTKIHRLDNLDGTKFESGFAVSGGIYKTLLEFPFEGKIKTPLWFSYDPQNTIYRQQLIQAEIIGIEDLNENHAKAEIFVYQTSQGEHIRNIFPQVVMPESLYDMKGLFPFGSLKTDRAGHLLMISSLTQDGGNRTLIADSETDPGIVLYAEGWFNHWQSYGGHIRIKKSFLQEIMDYIEK